MATSAFTGDPQPVEIHHRGIWYAGDLLGWRHTSDGRVSARVRCIVDGLRYSAWIDLCELRLPDPAHPPRREPFPAPPAPPVAGAPVDHEDRTRPDNHFPALSARARRPAHVCAPPAPRTAPTADPAAAAPLLPVPAAGTTAPVATPRPRPTPHRRGVRLR